MKKITIFTILITLFITTGCSQKDSGEEKAQLTQASTIVNKMVGKKVSPRPDDAILAPNFELLTVNGEQFNLSDLRGKVVLLNFWGTWCAPCRKEIPDFNKLYSKHRDKGLEIVGITLSSGTPKDIKDFMQEWKMEYTVLTEIKGNETAEVTNLYGKALGQPISGIPTTLIIDRDGYIVKAYIGPRSEEIFFNALKPYL